MGVGAGVGVGVAVGAAAFEFADEEVFPLALLQAATRQHKTADNIRPSTNLRLITISTPNPPDGFNLGSRVVKHFLLVEVPERRLGLTHNGFR